MPSGDQAKAGVRLAFVFAAIGVACLTGAPVGGLLIERREGGGYLYAQIFAGTAVFVGGFFFAAARVGKAGWKLKRL